MPAAALRTDQEIPVVRRENRRPVTFRLNPQAIELVDQAASRLHKHRTAFVEEAAVAKAKEVLLDQTVFSLSAENYAAFVEALDNPVEPTACLKALAKKKPLWER